MNNTKASEVPYNKAEQACEAKAYLAYVEQASAVPTQEDGAYHAFEMEGGKPQCTK